MIQQTSLQAYSELDNSELQSRYREILQLLAQRGPMTDREIARQLGFTDPNAVRPRRHELTELNYVFPLGKRKCNVTGKTSIEWGI
jgi:hypothetical protein